MGALSLSRRPGAVNADHFRRPGRRVTGAGARSTLPTLSPDGRQTERSVQITQDILQQAGILKRRLAYSEFITNDFLPK